MRVFNREERNAPPIPLSRAAQKRRLKLFDDSLRPRRRIKFGSELLEDVGEDRFTELAAWGPLSFREQLLKGFCRDNKISRIVAGGKDGFFEGLAAQYLHPLFVQASKRSSVSVLYGVTLLTIEFLSSVTESLYGLAMQFPEFRDWKLVKSVYTYPNQISADVYRGTCSLEEKQARKSILVAGVEGVKTTFNEDTGRYQLQFMLAIVPEVRDFKKKIIRHDVQTIRESFIAELIHEEEVEQQLGLKHHI